MEGSKNIVKGELYSKIYFEIIFREWGLHIKAVVYNKYLIKTMLIQPDGRFYFKLVNEKENQIWIIKKFTSYVNCNRINNNK